MLLNNQGLRRNKKCFEACENRKTTYQNLWDEAKSSLRGKFIVINAYIKKKERAQINNQNLCLKELEKRTN